MLVKHSHFSGESDAGPTAMPLFGPADAHFEKVASAHLMPEVTQYISGLRPVKTSQYVLVNAMGAGEFYGCFPAGTLVETERGEVPIELVGPGDDVRTHRNRYRQVLARVPKQAEELCDLYVQGLPRVTPALTATPNHELWVVPREEFLKKLRKFVYSADTSVPIRTRREVAVRNMELSWVPISSLRPGDYIVEPFEVEEDAHALGDEVWNDQGVAWLMGLYAAEGCVAREYKTGFREIASVVYVTGGGEARTHSAITAAAESLGYSFSKQISESETSARLQVCSKEFATLCEEHIGSSAENKFLSPALLRMPRAWQQVFLSAYFGGDGYVTIQRRGEGSLRATSASARLLMGIRKMAARQGMVGSVSGRHNKKTTWYNGNPIYELLLGSSQFTEKSQAKSYLHPCGYILSSVKKVKQYKWHGEVFDLTVEKDSSFVASGIAAHNSNINGDHFPEAGLIHKPDDWSGNPVLDRVKAKTWYYGFPTFYLAHPFAHHKNKDPGRAFGEVELALWNPHMRRVELVTRLDHDKCFQFGGTGVWDKLKAGGFPDVSMGSKVPFDTCSICLDWGLYKEALSTYDPKKHAHPGQAVLQFHKKLKEDNGVGIRGLSITRKDYCEHAAKHMNRILPDGRKVFVYNDFPRFFDISFVFIGADRTAKTMLFIFSGGKQLQVRPSADVSEMLSSDGDGEKTASASDSLLIQAFGKVAKPKTGEITKDYVPSNIAPKAVPVLTKREPDLSEEVLGCLSNLPLEKGLSTLGGLGMVLRPREFQTVVLRQLKQKGLADRLNAEGKVFPRVDEAEPLPLSPGDFLPALLPLLLPFLAMRSGLGPLIEERVLVLPGFSEKEKKSNASLSTELMRKIGATYNGYRSSLMDLVAHSQNILGASGVADRELSKIASASVDSVFTPLSTHYLHSAFMDEVGDSSPRVVQVSERAAADVERGLPSKTACTTQQVFGGIT